MEEGTTSSRCEHDAANLISVLVVTLHSFLQIEIPEGQTLCGFFGGTGGHLHHVGAVLMDAPASVATSFIATEPTVSASLSSYLKTLSQCEQFRMSECGMLQYYDPQHGASLHRQSNVAQLAGELFSIISLFAD